MSAALPHLVDLVTLAEHERYDSEAARSASLVKPRAYGRLASTNNPYELLVTSDCMVRLLDAGPPANRGLVASCNIPAHPGGVELLIFREVTRYRFYLHKWKANRALGKAGPHVFNLLVKTTATNGAILYVGIWFDEGDLATLANSSTFFKQDAQHEEYANAKILYYNDPWLPLWGDKCLPDYQVTAMKVVLQSRSNRRIYRGEPILAAYHFQETHT